MLIGYARCSTDAQEPHRPARGTYRARRATGRIYTDHGLTGTNRARPGLREALAACRAGDTLVVTKLDRLARSLPDARDIAGELTNAGVKLNIGGSLHDPDDPVGRLLFNVLAMIAEFESDLIRMRTREGMKVARAKGRLRGKQPKLKPAQEAHLVELWRAGSTPAPNSPSCSPSPAPPSTAPCSAPANRRRRFGCTARKQPPLRRRDQAARLCRRHLIDLRSVRDPDPLRC
jgi:DNA invertase Pin-like site-specific DNA recombinase